MFKTPMSFMDKKKVLFQLQLKKYEICFKYNLNTIIGKKRQKMKLKEIINKRKVEKRK